MARTPTLAPVFYLDLIGFDFTLTLSWIDRYLSVDQREAPVARLISDSAPRLFTCREGRPAQGHVFGLEGAPKVRDYSTPVTPWWPINSGRLTVPQPRGLGGYKGGCLLWVKSRHWSADSRCPL